MSHDLFVKLHSIVLCRELYKTKHAEKQLDTLGDDY